MRPKYPRHSVEKALRISRAILEQNAGKACTPKEAAAYLGMKAQGPFNVEVGSGIKYGFLERPESGKIKPTDLARQILRPKNAESALEGYRTAVLQAPDISEVYKHYRGENLPDDVFFKNTIADSFSIPEDSFEDFKQVFVESLQTAQLVNDHTGKLRVLDVSEESSSPEDKDERIKRMGAKVTVHSTDTCFVMQPFAAPLGGYYDKIYKPAIEKAGLQAVRADAEIFATGKIMDQVWRGINSAKVLVAELTSRNPNVFYELGLAHALKKPVVLISSNENDVPFDLHHIRVIYYEMSDPFWGNKLIDKVAENILSALRNPEEAIFRSGDISA
ncbi:MAG TPA: hypothetical protein DCS43_05890 [Verrucomicrobia bacterium]|nr:hypothetical protein [Verrucomicrobiota bacterium]